MAGSGGSSTLEEDPEEPEVAIAFDVLEEIRAGEVSVPWGLLGFISEPEPPPKPTRELYLSPDGTPLVWDAPTALLLRSQYRMIPRPIGMGSIRNLPQVKVSTAPVYESDTCSTFMTSVCGALAHLPARSVYLSRSCSRRRSSPWRGAGSGWQLGRIVLITPARMRRMHPARIGKSTCPPPRSYEALSAHVKQTLPSLMQARRPTAACEERPANH